MTDFEMIKKIYINANIKAYITSNPEECEPIIEDYDNEITYWFNKDGSLDFITNDKNY